MRRRSVNTTKICLTTRLNQDFGSTHYPFFTTAMSPKFFWIFLNTSNRPLVHRGCGGTPLWESRLQQKPSSVPAYSGCESPVNFCQKEWLWKMSENEKRECEDVDYEKVITVPHIDFTSAQFISSVDGLRIQCTLPAVFNSPVVCPDSMRNGDMYANSDKPDPFSVDIILYPHDVLYVPPHWHLTAGPVPEGYSKRAIGKAEKSRSRPLRCLLRTYPALLRQGHFTKADYLDAHSESEKEFLRKTVHKAVRWDEVGTGPRKVF